MTAIKYWTKEGCFEVSLFSKIPLEGLHRTDGPAVEYENGGREWWVNGELHRIGGPASEWADGSREWRVNGKWHRIDGPAIEWGDGGLEWHLSGHRVTEEEHKAAVAKGELYVKMRYG